MKKIVIILTFSLVLFGYTHRVNADNICYDVGGEIRTNTISLTQQSGTIELLLTNQEIDEEVRLEGEINGMIIGDDADGAIYLTHTATSNDESTPFTFVTLYDRAVFLGAPEGCTIPISETITNIIGGDGFTANVTYVDIVVNGSIGVCSGTPNYFEDISGVICIDQE